MVHRVEVTAAGPLPVYTGFPVHKALRLWTHSTKALYAQGECTPENYPQEYAVQCILSRHRG